MFSFPLSHSEIHSSVIHFSKMDDSCEKSTRECNTINQIMLINIHYFTINIQKYFINSNNLLLIYFIEDKLIMQNDF